MKKILTKGLLALFLSTGFLASGCSDDDNPASSDESAHMDAVGVALVMGGDTLVMAATADPTEVSGELELHEGESAGPVLVHFLDDEGHWFRPDADPDGDHTLDIATNELMLSIELDQAEWAFTATGLAEGETAMRVKILHLGHEDYVSPELPVHVIHSDDAHGTPVGMRLFDGDTLLLECFANGTVSSGLELTMSEALSFSTWFVDDEGVVFQPEDDHYLGLSFNAELIQSSVDGWNVTLTPVAAGDDVLIIDILHEGHSHYTSPQIAIHVD
jgi:hypothetical protein